ncbi:hypothetical protein [Aeromonas salmonicida]|uniref:hypothetical protein n=1 Tax=Aeromonas salmonicida TaxID=645 RepID=UPI0037EC6149
MKLTIELTPEMRVRLMHAENLEIEVHESIVQEQLSINASAWRAMVLESIVATFENDGGSAIDIDGRRYVSAARLEQLAASLRQQNTSGDAI